MNTTWSSSFTKINPITKHNESFQSNILQEFLRTNGLHVNRNQNTSKNSSEVTANENLHSEKKSENEMQEICVQVTSRSVTRLRDENISENTSVLKVYSKTTLKEKESSDNKCLKEEEDTVSFRRNKLFTEKEDTVSFRRNQTHEESNRLKSLCSWTEEKCVSCNKREKEQFPVNEIRNTEDRIIGDAFFSYPPELVEIYFSKKGKEDDECCASNSGESVFLFSRINSRNIGEASHIGQKVEESDSLNEDKFAEPTRDRQNFINFDVEKHEECVNSKINKKETEECKDSLKSDVKEEKCSSEGLKLKELRDASVIDKVSSLKDSSVIDADNLHSLEGEKFIRIDKENCVTVEELGRPNDNEQNLNKDSDESYKTNNVNLSEFEENILTNQNTFSNSIFAKAEVIESNKISVKSTENEMSKSILPSGEFSDSKFSKTDLSSKENVTIVPKEEKLNCKEDSVANSLKENKMKTIIEKRENKEDNFNKNTTDDTQIDSFNKDAQLTSIINDIKGKKENSRDSSNEITGIEIEDPKSGMIARETARINDNYKNINICKMLTSIHEQLSYDLQRMKRMEAKLLGKVSTDSVNHTMALQLLDKTVARCKSYIHGSNNSQVAESEIIKIFLTHGVQLMIAVNKNKAALDEQEHRINEMQYESLHGRNNKRSILKEINLSWNFWKEKIIYLIETISCLVKNVMANNNNEEKENVKSLRKYKPVHRPMANNPSTHDAKPKSASGRSKTAKINVYKKESPVETQISIVSNSKSFVKPLSNSTNREKGKVQNDAQISERKIMEKGRTMKELNLNKHRVFSNQQPVWRPGGTVKISSSNSATTLQKARTNVKDKIQPFTEHLREEKLNRTMTLSKKKVSNEVSSMRNMLSSNTHGSKIVGKRSNTSLKISPRMKPKSGILKAASKNCNEPGYPNLKHCDNRSANDEARQKTSKDSKISSTLKRVIKSSEMNCKEERNSKCVIKSYQFPLTFETPSELIVRKEKKEEIPINKEEPTRDVDCNKCTENYTKSSDTVEENDQTVDRIPNASLTPKKDLDLSRNIPKKFGNYVDAGINTNGFSNFISIENCMADFSSNSECTTKFEVSSRLISSSIQTREKRLMDGFILPIHDEEKRKDALLAEKEKIRKNSHALSLNVLREFLCEQGIDADFVNRAERELKVKQKARRNSRKKSITFADEDKSLQKNVKDESLNMRGKQKESCVNCERNLRNAEDVRNHKSLKYVESREENDINLEKNLRNIENQKEGNSNCENNLKCAENYKEDNSYYEKSLKYSEDHQKSNINYENSLKYSEDHQTGNFNCENSLKCTKDPKENVPVPEKLKQSENDQKNIVKDPPKPEMKDASCCTDKNTNDASSQTNFHSKSLQTLQTIPTHLRTVETQTETKQVKHVRNLTNEVTNVSSMTDTLPVKDNFMEATRAKSVSTEQIDYVFLNDFNKNLTEAFSDELSTKMVSNEDSSKRCRNFFHQLLNQVQEKCNECSDCEENDASKELRFVESNASMLCSSSSESLKNRGTVMKEANTSPIRSVSSETMAAFHVTAIRIRNVFRAIDIYKRKLRNEPKKAEETLSKRGLDVYKKKPSYVSKSSSVDTIFQKRNDNDENSAVRIYEELRQVESRFNQEDDDSESIKSLSSTTWSYESTFGEVELKLSGKLSDTIVLKDVKPLIEFLVQKTEDSMLEKKNSIRNVLHSKCRKIRNKEVVQFSVFSRENLLPLVYGVVCCVVFWCLRFTVTCDVVL